MKPNQALGVRFRRIGERMFLMRGQTAFEIDQVGFEIWGMCDGTGDLNAIVNALADRYPDVGEHTLHADCSEFLEQLQNAGLVEI